MAWAGPLADSYRTGGSGRILVLIPHQNQVSMEWALRFRELDMPQGSAFNLWGVAPIDIAREKLAENLLANKEFEWSIWLDSDVIPPKDFVARLMRVPEPIVSGVYPARKTETDQKMPAAWVVGRNAKGELGHVPIPWEQHGLVEANVAGFGCVKIHRSVFEKVPRPWFLWTLDRYIDGKQLETPMSEDFYFYQKAKKNGFRLVVDMDLRCLHEASGFIDSTGKFRLGTPHMHPPEVLV